MLFKEFINSVFMETMNPTEQKVFEEEDSERNEYEEEPQKIEDLIHYIDGNIFIEKCADGRRCFITHIIPYIKDIEIIEQDNKPKVVMVTFADETVEKAVLDDEDSFNLEQGISICLTKKLLSDKHYGNGSAIYNKLIKHAVKVFYDKQKEEAKQRMEEVRIRAKEEKIKRKNAARRKKREEMRREEAIEIQKEAYIRAMKELSLTSILEFIKGV